jgi:cell division inhibitor SepF
MAGGMRKVGVYLGLLEDTDRYEDDYYADDESEHGDEQAVRPVRAVRDDRPASVASLAERRRPSASAAELSRITTLHPRTYNEARTIG